MKKKIWNVDDKYYTRTDNVSRGKDNKEKILNDMKEELQRKNEIIE